MEFCLHVHHDQLFQYSWSDSELCVGRTSSGPVIIIHASLLTLSDSLPTAFQLLETVKSSYKYLVSFSVFHHALGYTQCSLSLHVLEVCDYKYNLLWVFRMRGCWELFSEITLQKKKSSQTGNAAQNPALHWERWLLRVLENGIRFSNCLQ